jgi:hypothetical protein
MSLNLDLIKNKRKAAQEEAERARAQYFNFKPGRNTVRIMPPWEGSDDFSRECGRHWMPTSDGKRVPYYCPKECAGAPCPICEKISAMFKAGVDDTTKEQLKSISSSGRYLVNLVDKNDEAKGVQIAELPKTVINVIWGIMVDEDLGVGDVTHPDNGFDLYIDKTGTGLGTRYEVYAKKVPSAINKSWLAGIVNLDTLIKLESYENLKLVWEGKPLEPETKRPGLPAPEPKTVTGEAVDAEAPAGTTATALADKGLPPCFGSFNETLPKCLDCPEQDDCEAEVAAIKGTAAKPKETVAPATVATPAAAVGTSMSAEELMREMEAAL